MKRDISAHDTHVRDEDIKASSERSFGIVFAVVFALVGLWPLTGDGGPRWWAIGVAAGFVVTAFAYPRVLSPFNRLWLRFGLLLNRIISPLVLGFVFFVVVTPIGLLLRITGKDVLRLKAPAGDTSFWIARDDRGPARETMKNQY